MGRPSQCNPCCGDVDPPDPPTGSCDNVLCVALIDENEQTGGSSWASKFVAFEQTFPNRVLIVLDVAGGNVSLNAPFLDSPRATSLRYEFDQDATNLIQKLERDQGVQAIADSNDPWARVVEMIDRLSLTTWLNNDCSALEVIISDDGGMTDQQVEATSLKLVQDANASLGIPFTRSLFTDDDFICPFVSETCCTYANLDALESLCGGDFTCIPEQIQFTLQPNDCTNEDYGCVADPPAPGEAVYGTCVTNECDQIDNVRFGATAFNSVGQNISWSTIEYTLQYSDDDGDNWSDSLVDFGEDFSGEPQQVSSLGSSWLGGTSNSFSSTPVGTQGCVKNTYDRMFRIKAQSVEYPSLEAISNEFSLYFWTLEDVSGNGWTLLTVPSDCGDDPHQKNSTIPIDQFPVRSDPRFGGPVPRYTIPVDTTKLHGYGLYWQSIVCNISNIKQQSVNPELYADVYPDPHSTDTDLASPDLNLIQLIKSDFANQPAICNSVFPPFNGTSIEFPTNGNHPLGYQTNVPYDQSVRPPYWEGYELGFILDYGSLSMASRRYLLIDTVGGNPNAPALVWGEGVNLNVGVGTIYADKIATGFGAFKTNPDGQTVGKTERSILANSNANIGPRSPAGREGGFFGAPPDMTSIIDWCFEHEGDSRIDSTVTGNPNYYVVCGTSAGDIRLVQRIYSPFLGDLGTVESWILNINIGGGAGYVINSRGFENPTYVMTTGRFTQTPNSQPVEKLVLATNGSRVENGEIVSNGLLLFAFDKNNFLPEFTDVSAYLEDKFLDSDHLLGPAISVRDPNTQEVLEINQFLCVFNTTGDGPANRQIIKINMLDPTNPVVHDEFDLETNELLNYQFPTGETQEQFNRSHKFIGYGQWVTLVTSNRLESPYDKTNYIFVGEYPSSTSDTNSYSPYPPLIGPTTTAGTESQISTFGVAPTNATNQLIEDVWVQKVFESSTNDLFVWHWQDLDESVPNEVKRYRYI